MVEYKINVKESLMDKLLFRNVVNCSVDIIAHSDDGVYYELYPGFLPGHTPKLVKFESYSYNEKFDKTLNDLTSNSKSHIEYICEGLILVRPGVREVAVVNDHYYTEELIKLESDRMAKRRTDDIIKAPRIKCKVHLLVDSSMYKMPSQCIICGSEYKIDIDDLDVGDRLLNPFSLPERIAWNRAGINDVIESLERRD